MIPSLAEIQEEVEFEINYLVIAATFVNDCLTIYHICCYTEAPSKEDTDGLWLELHIDSEFGLSEEIFEHLELTVVTIAQYQELFDSLKVLGEDEDGERDRTEMVSEQTE